MKTGMKAGLGIGSLLTFGLLGVFGWSLTDTPKQEMASAAKEKSYAAGTVIQARVTNQAGGATNTLYLYGMLY